MENLPAQAIPIVVPEEQTNKFSLKEKVLEEILLQEDIADRIAIPVSVTGAFRQGKSFLLDFCIRYLESLSNSSSQKTDDWLGDENSPLEGFSWRGGSERNTTGILMWSNVFKVDLPTGEKAAVILLDTQGTFDDKSTVRECATIFALSTLLSSIQIFNIFHNLREDHLQHLELFIEYGKLFGHNIGYKPFQKLQFLIRDWSWPYEKNYGSEGGQALLNERLKITDKKAPEQKSLRNNINSCFTDIQCFLMPHPGSKASTNPDFDGRLSDIDAEFKTYLKQLIPMLLSAENLVQKEIGGQKIKVKELLIYLKGYIKLFDRDDLPEPKSMLLATAEANILSAMAMVRENFNEAMLKTVKNSEPYLTPPEIEEEYIKTRSEAVKQFDEKPKMGGDEVVELYRTILMEGIESDYNRFKIYNEGKAKASNQMGLAAGKESYFQNMASACKNVDPYLSVGQFKQAHEKYAEMALIQFRNYCKAEGDEFSYPYQQKLEQDIKIEHDRFFALNKIKAETNNREVTLASKEIYHKNMAEIVQTSNETFFTSEKLEQVHVKCKSDAIEHFNRRCIPNGDEFSDACKINLEKDIDDDFEHFKLFNENKKETYILSNAATVKETYYRNMSASCAAADPYLTKDEMEAEHVRCLTEAIQKITANHELPESYEIKLKDSVNMDYNSFKDLNKSKAEAHNQLAFSSAKDAYYRQMTIILNSSPNPFGADEFNQKHETCKTAALEQFAKQCKKSPDEFSETYSNLLDKEIATDRNWFQIQNECKPKVAQTINVCDGHRRRGELHKVLDDITEVVGTIGVIAASPVGAFLKKIF